MSWVNEEMAELREQLAAARREVETAQQRCEWVATALHGDPMFGAGCDEPLVRKVRELQADLATSRVALEDVRNWAMLHTRPCVAIGCTTCPRCSLFVILNRALAQEAGDAT